MIPDSSVVLAKRPTKKKSGFEVEVRKDGFYYVTAVPGKSKDVHVGDRVLEINGVAWHDFGTVKKANGLFETVTFNMDGSATTNDQDQEKKAPGKKRQQSKKKKKDDSKSR